MDKTLGDCRRQEIPTEVFVHDPEDKNHEALVEIAQDVCRDCPLKADCFTFGLKEGMVGVWGGAWLELPPEDGSSFS